MILTTYTGEKLSILGKLIIDVKHCKQHKQLPLYVVKGNGPSLLGRNWLTEINLNWNTPKPQMSCEKQMKSLTKNP